jgi:putative Mg2+ transporter-C (MgtC) family protein
MPLYPTWSDVAVRLALTMVAGIIIGLNRESGGQAAGLRTTTLVALAAAIAMIQTNLLLPVEGKAATSFVTMDLMRLPLGILTGVGFIGGGAILKHGGSIRGVTTAATLWIVTALGLCFGGGQWGLGIAGTVLSVVTLHGMKQLDLMVSRQVEALLKISVAVGSAAGDPTPCLAALGCRATLMGQKRLAASGGTELHFALHWRQRRDRNRVPALLAALKNFDVMSFEITKDGD